MSQDIRSFFRVASKKTGDNSNKGPEVKSKKKKTIIDSDDEDIIEDTPRKTESKLVTVKRNNLVISSDSEDDSKEKRKAPSKKSKSKEELKLKPVNIDDVFDNTPVKQSKVEVISKIEHDPRSAEIPKKKSKQKHYTELGIHDDEAFEKTLLDLDDDILVDNVDILDKTVDEALQNTQNEALKGHNSSVHKSEKKRQRKSQTGTASKKPKLEHTDSGIDPDQDAFEKRRYSAMLYQKYKNRGGPLHHGEKEIPKGKPDCLRNLTFVRTGVLDSLEGDEFENLIKEHGGRVVHAVSKKVTYIVVGENPGPAKMDKARGLNIPDICEDDVLNMILTKSGMEPKFGRNKSAASSESGIATEEETSPKAKKTYKSPVREKKVKVEKVEENIKKMKPSVKEERAIDNFSGSADKTDKKPNLKKLAEKTELEGSGIINKKQDPTSAVSKYVTHQINKSHKVPQIESPKPEAAMKPSKSQIKIKEETVSRNKSININQEPSCSTEKSVTHKIIKSQDLPQIERPKIEISDTTKTWAEKYKPKDMKSIIGQQDGNSNLNKLRKWLQNWDRNQQPEVHKKIPRPSPWAKNDDGAYYKAALLSGPPGVGKTTTATLVSQELGLDVVEFNASDTRSKRLLHEEVSQLLSTNTIAGFAAGKKTTDKKRVLLMDEVDGMAGNEDRGGMQELINLIKNSSIPIICMCNDRNHQKIRSLVNYCFDLKFNKPRFEQIRGAMMSICFKEGIHISPNSLAELISGTGCDIRQTLNHLSMWSAADKNLSMETVQRESKAAKKDTVLGPWEVVRMVFSESEHKNMTLMDKSRLFFYDYSLGPLFVQENYLSVTPHCDSKQVMKRVALAADAISMGDIIDAKIRGSNNWSLLESQAMYSSVLPGFYMSGNITKKINFPGWLGKNSTASKQKRMLSELHMHTRTSTSGSKMALKLDYLLHLRNAIVNPLKKYGVDGVHEAIEVMKAYNLLREDLNNLIELSHWKDMKNPFNDVEAKVKSAFTRVYNKEVPLLPFAANAGVAKKRAAAAEPDLLDEDHVESDIEENDDVTADAMIKVKNKTESKKPTKPSKTKETKAKGRAKKAK